MCTGGLEGVVYIPMGVHWGVLRGVCTYLRVCVEGDVCIPMSVHLGC